MGLIKNNCTQCGRTYLCKPWELHAQKRSCLRLECLMKAGLSRKQGMEQREHIKKCRAADAARNEEFLSESPTGFGV